MNVQLQYLKLNESRLSNFHPLAKLLSASVLVLSLSLADNEMTLLGLWIWNLLLLIFSNPPKKWIVQQLIIFGIALCPFILILPFQPSINWDWNGKIENLYDSIQEWFKNCHFHESGLRAAWIFFLRTTAMIMVLLFLMASTPVYQLFYALRKMGVPKGFVQILLLGYRYLYLIRDEWNRRKIAMHSRGYQNRTTWHSYRTLTHSIITLIHYSMQRGDAVIHSMKNRGYHGEFYLYKIGKLKKRDWLFMLFHLSLLVAINLGSYLME